ncbi:glycosyl hydrolase family 28-related protein [Sphingopyxis sp. LARHCG72]
MFKYTNAFTNRSGDSLPGYFARLYDSDGNQVDLFADASGTPIATISGVANAALSDENGMFRWYVANGTYDIRFFDANDVFVAPAEIGVPMFEASQVLVDLSGDDGATLVGTPTGTVQDDLDAASAAIAERPTSVALATSTGGDGIGFLQSGTDALLRSVSDKLLGFVDVLDFIPGSLHANIRAGTNTTDLTTYIQKAIDSLQTRGGTVYFPAGRYKTTDTLTMRSGVDILGSGRHIDFNGGLNLYGSWIDYQGATSDPCLSFYGREAIAYSNMGILCVEASNQTAIFIGSDNAPAAKRLTFSHFTIVAADIGVQWGNANADNPLEQCDDMTFSDGYFISCGDGFVIDAANAADYSKVERISFENVKRTAFYMKKAAFIRIADCAAGLIFNTSIMFKLEGVGPDPIVISLCQSEAGNGKFLTYNPITPNDQGQVILDANIINQPVEINGNARALSRGNFNNSTITTTGFVRFKSEDDVWDGVYGQPIHVPQVIVASPGQFSARCMKNSVSYFGHSLPNNFRIENGEATAGGFEGVVVTRAGVHCTPFIPAGEFGAGQYVQPTVDNTHAYLVTVGGTTGTEPSWPTGSGATVTSGTVTFQEVGTNAILKGYGAIAA